MNFFHFKKILSESAQYLKSELPQSPKIGIILGTGYYSLADELKNSKIIPYSSIPGFPKSSLPGQISELIFGEWKGKNILIFKKRFHYYEGFTPLESTIPVWLVKELGAEYLILTTASGGVNPKLREGDLMLIDDQINLTNKNPLMEIPIEERNPLFLNLSSLYNAQLKEEAIKIAQKNGVEVKKGIYAGVIGPTYETLAEIKMLEKLGVDAVGMSLIFESIIACYLNLKTFAISVISNKCDFHYMSSLSHEKVIENVEKKVPDLKKILGELVKVI
ncbi:MAG: purine-nucleoside phosphorylase [Candidatus Aminicenantia bacterium]